MIVVLFSGGIDSWACLHWAISCVGKDNIMPLFVNFGQTYASKEYAAAEHLCALQNIKLRKLNQFTLTENLDDAHIPLRNTYLLMHAASIEGATGVVFGMLKGESCEDKNPAYVKHMQKLFDSQFAKSIYRNQTKPFKIYTPFHRHTKKQLVEWCINNTPAYGLNQTVGCFGADERPCGQCISCFNRWVGRYLNDLADENYVVHPWFYMAANINAMHRTRRDNKELFTLQQMWLKKFWILDSFVAMRRFSMKQFKMGLAEALAISTTLRKGM